MRRGWKIAIAVAAGLAIILALNTIALDNETKPAGVTIAGGRILHLPGGDLQVVDSGQPKGPRRKSGPPIVILPCYTCSVHWWDRVAPLLEKRHRVIRIDLLGEGGSAKPSGPYSIESEASDVAAALSRLGVQGAVVVGHSLGADVATSLAQQASQLVDRLVIVDEAPDDSTENLPFVAKLGYVPVLGEAIWRTIPDFAIKDAIGVAFAPGYDTSSGFANPNQVVDDFRSMTYTSYDDLSTAHSDFVKQEPLDARIRSAAVPLQVIFGSEDQLWDDPRASAEAYRSVPGAGHSPNVEKPAETAALIEEFAANPGDETGGHPPRRIGLPKKHPASAGGSAAAPACSTPRVKRVHVRFASPKAGAVVKGKVIAHVVSTRPAACAATYFLAVDGTPYAPAGAAFHGPVSSRNPQLAHPLHASARHAANNPTPACVSARSSFVRLDLPKGRHAITVRGCPEGTHVPRAAPASVHLKVR